MQSSESPSAAMRRRAHSRKDRLWKSFSVKNAGFRRKKASFSFRGEKASENKSRGGYQGCPGSHPKTARIARSRKADAVRQKQHRKSPPPRISRQDGRGETVSAEKACEAAEKPLEACIPIHARISGYNTLSCPFAVLFVRNQGLQSFCKRVL